MTKLSANAETLFANLAKDADNWGGQPLFGEGGTYDPVLGYRGDRGLLTHLKKAGLVETFETKEPGSPKCLWVDFTEAGREKAREIGRERGWRAAAHFFSQGEIAAMEAAAAPAPEPAPIDLEAEPVHLITRWSGVPADEAPLCGVSSDDAPINRTVRPDARELDRLCESCLVVVVAEEEAKPEVETLRFIVRAENDADFDRRAEWLKKDHGLSSVRREENSPIHVDRSFFVRGEREIPADLPVGPDWDDQPAQCGRCDRYEPDAEVWKDWVTLLVEDSDPETGPTSSDFTEVSYCLDCALATIRTPLVVRFREVPIGREFALVEDVSRPHLRLAWEKTSNTYARVATGLTGCDFGAGQLVTLLPRREETR